MMHLYGAPSIIYHSKLPQLLIFIGGSCVEEYQQRKVFQHKSKEKGFDFSSIYSSHKTTQGTDAIVYRVAGQARPG